MHILYECKHKVAKGVVSSYGHWIEIGGHEIFYITQGSYTIFEGSQGGGHENLLSYPTSNMFVNNIA